MYTCAASAAQAVESLANKIVSQQVNRVLPGFSAVSERTLHTMLSVGWASVSSNGPLQQLEYELPPLSGSDVRIAVEHCSICFSDLDVLDNAFGGTEYPIVTGHEIIGTVLERGHEVTGLRVGARVGVGPLCGSCGVCEQCHAGKENLCSQQRMTPNSGLRGGFATVVQFNHRFVFAIPAVMDARTAAPLLCAGVTVFAPLNRHAPTPRRVGILGIGGLGHLAVQFASKMGHEVTAFTNIVTDDEVARLHALGATAIVDTTSALALRDASRSVDTLLSTVHGKLDFRPFIGALRPDGVMCIIGNTPDGPGDIALRLIHQQRSLAGSAAGSPSDTRAMLDFAALHDVAAMVEVAPFSQINEQIERVRLNEPRYRVVLEQ